MVHCALRQGTLLERHQLHQGVQRVMIRLTEQVVKLAVTGFQTIFE